MTHGVVNMIGGSKGLAIRLSTCNRDRDIIFSMCEGYGTVGGEAQVPALLEGWGIPFTFTDSPTLALWLDKKTKVRGIPACDSWPTPEFDFLSVIGRFAHREALKDFPLFITARSVSVRQTRFAAAKNWSIQFMQYPRNTRLSPPRWSKYFVWT